MDGQLRGLGLLQQGLGPVQDAVDVRGLPLVVGELGNHGGSGGTQRGQRCRGRGGGAPQGLQADQAELRHLPLVGAEDGLVGQHVQHEPDRDQVGDVAASEQRPHRNRHDPGALGEPVEGGVGEHVAELGPQVRERGHRGRRDRPPQHGDDVGHVTGQAERLPGQRAQGVRPGEHPGRGRRPALLRGGRQQRGGEVAVVGRLPSGTGRSRSP